MAGRHCLFMRLFTLLPSVQCCGNTRLFQLDYIFRKEKHRSTSCKQPLNAFLMSSLCLVFLISLVFRLYHDATHTTNGGKTHYWRAGWFSDLIWLFSENGLSIAEVPGGGIKDPTQPFAYFRSVIPLSLLPQPDIFVARTSRWSALMPSVGRLLSSHIK